MLQLRYHSVYVIYACLIEMMQCGVEKRVEEKEKLRCKVHLLDKRKISGVVHLTDGGQHDAIVLTDLKVLHCNNGLDL